MNLLKKYRRFLYPVLGAAGGFLYYHFIGCASGTCPITSNPYVSTLYGAGMGVLFGWANKKEQQP
jgi:hypothetical protein